MKYGDVNLSDSADAQRIQQYIDACQAAVDAWDEMAEADSWCRFSQRYGMMDSAVAWGHEAGKQRAIAKQAVWLADSLL